MLVLRRFLVALFGILFVSAISLFVVSRSLSTVLGQPSNVKAQLIKSGFYKDLPEEFYAKIQKSLNPDSTIVGAPVSRPEIKEAFLEALSPARLQKLTEASIDTFYSSLASPSGNPQISLDVSEVKQSFADSLAQRVTTRLNTLPVCKSVTGSTDPFEITCRPPGLDIQTESEAIKKNVLSNQDFLPQATVSVDTLQNGDLTKTSQPTQSFQSIKNGYRWLMRLPWIAGILSIVLATLLVLIAPQRLKGAKAVFYILLIFGLLSAIGITLASKIAASEVKANLSSEAPAAVQSAALAFLAQLQREMLIYYAGAAIIGLFALIGIALFRRHTRITRG